MEASELCGLWMGCLLWGTVLPAFLVEAKDVTFKYKVAAWFFLVSGCCVVSSTLATVAPPMRRAEAPVISATILALLMGTSSLVCMSGLSCLIKSSRFGVILGGLSLLAWLLTATTATPSLIEGRLLVLFAPSGLVLFGLFSAAAAGARGLRRFSRSGEIKNEENTKSLILGIPGLLLQFAGSASKEGTSEELAPIFGLLMVVGTGLLIWGLCYYAEAKGRSGYWGACGLLSIFGVIILACLRNDNQQAQRPEQEGNEGQLTAPESTAEPDTPPTPPEDE